MLEFAALRREHQDNQLLGDFGLQAFGVTLAQADDINDHAAVVALGILQDFRSAGARQMSPSVGARVLAQRVVDVTGLRIDDVGLANARSAAIFRGPGRSIGQRLVAEFMLARLEDEREVRRRGSRYVGSSSPPRGPG